MSAARGPQGLDSETLHRQLSLLRSYVDPKVVNQMIRFFAPQILLADDQLLSQLYDTAKASPLTSTRASLRADEGLVFNGAFAGGTPSRYEEVWPILLHIPDVQVAVAWPKCARVVNDLCPSILVLVGQCC